jgi:hypothetical protein
MNAKNAILSIPNIAFFNFVSSESYACTTAAASFAKYSFTQSVVTDFGRSNGNESARDQQAAANTPNALDTPKSTV